MNTLKIIIGEKNYSSWSLRGWLAVAHTCLDFEEMALPLDTPEFYDRIAELNPSRKVPALYHGDVLVWDSLAIMDYCARIAPEQYWWPEDMAAFARAKSVTAEMHSGFPHLRAHAPMNMRGRWSGLSVADNVQTDIDRVLTIWSECREQFGKGGDFLFGGFSAADMMYAPVVSRLTTYNIEVSPVVAAYMEAVRTYPSYKRWYDAALREKAIVRADEIAPDATTLG